MTKDEIVPGAENVFAQLTGVCNNISTDQFLLKPDSKWSVAENLQHLILSTKMTTLAYRLPKFMVRWVGGKPNRPSRTFDELLAKYNKKLVDGGKASGAFVPKPLQIKAGKEDLIARWNKVTTHFIKSLKQNRTEEDLDNYLARHPLLGRITLRELCYFTIFHTQHHLETIKKISA